MSDRNTSLCDAIDTPSVSGSGVRSAARRLTGALLMSAGMGMAAFCGAQAVAAPTNGEILALAKDEVPSYLNTLRELVGIESGSRDLGGIDRLATWIAQRLRALGGEAAIVPPTEVYRMGDTPDRTGPMVRARFKGRGTSKVMFIAHMDTVYPKGMLKDQPFRIDGDRAYGLGVGDDKQGIALILHAIALMKELDAANYGTLTVLINSDEEISSPGSRATLMDTAADQDVVLSFEGSSEDGEVRLATSGIGAVYLNVRGEASHAGASPEGGVNALTELTHQLLQMQVLSQPQTGLKLTWTMATAGSRRNVIPADASAQADARALRLSDFERLATDLQERARNKLLPDAKVDVRFELRRPPLQATQISRTIADMASGIYREIGMSMTVQDMPTGEGTDAAFAGVRARGAVLEGLGIASYGAHSSTAEYVLLPTIAPRLYLVARLVAETRNTANTANTATR